MADEIFAPDYANHTSSPGGLAPRGSGLKQLVSMLRATFTGFQMTLEDLIAEEDKVVESWVTSNQPSGDSPNQS